MRYLHIFSIIIFLSSCTQVEDNREQSSPIKNSESDDITFIISLKVNSNSTENLSQFIEEITQNVINTEDFCLEYGYFLSVDGSSVTLYEKYEDSDGATKHGENFIEGPFFDRFFNLFTLENFIVTGPASDEFKKFTSENGFVIEYRESVDGFIR
jgi:quinol monooxygenase YgiN|tara:strand:- start:697 stop:1161 length:465 start_codon:yes stop_codon:yes gene_type:complete